MNHALRILAVLALASLSDSAFAETLKGTLYKQQQCDQVREGLGKHEP